MLDGASPAAPFLVGPLRVLDADSSSPFSSLPQFGRIHQHNSDPHILGFINRYFTVMHQRNVRRYLVIHLQVRRPVGSSLSFVLSTG